MTKVLVYVEGQTEETFIRDVLGPHLDQMNIELTPVLARTKRTASGTTYKGGIVSCGRVRPEILRLLRNTNAVLVTTMIDYYGLPDDFPGRAHVPPGTPYERVAFLEEAFRKDINHRRFLPFLTLHEFEALLFAQPDEIVKAFAKAGGAHPLIQEACSLLPEEVDEGKDTHPTARITKHFPAYRKPLHGPLIARRIGLPTIRARCPHFDAWVRNLESLQVEREILCPTPAL
jgi:hypothetical protein